MREFDEEARQDMCHVVFIKNKINKQIDNCLRELVKIEQFVNIIYCVISFLSEIFQLEYNLPITKYDKVISKFQKCHTESSSLQEKRKA